MSLSLSVSFINCFLKHLGILKVGDNAAIYLLAQILADKSESDVIKFECAKSMILLGNWQDDVCLLFAKLLVNGNPNVQAEILQTIIKGKNAQYTDLVKINQSLSHFALVMFH
jgi:hypothetical protein